MSDQGDISLKVMRISRPILHQESPIYTDDDEDLEFNSNYSGLSNSLLIPNSVGDFYLGEPANFMVTVQNQNQIGLENIRVVILTESRNVQRTTVHDSRRSDPLLKSELETIYFKIDCRYPEEIAMMCEISYDKGNQKDLNFKRKYLLPVKTPFEINWDWTVLGAGQNMLKISIINKIEKQIIFEECKIKDQSVKITTIHESSKKILKMNNILTKSFFIESPIADFTNVQLSLDLIWKSENGNRGHIQYSQIRPKVNPKDEIEVKIKTNQPAKRLESSDIEVKIENNTERNIDLIMELNLDQDQLIQWNGQTRQVIGLLQPKSKKEINLSIVPLQKGTLQLPKLAFKDTLLGLTYNFNNLHFIDVE